YRQFNPLRLPAAATSPEFCEAPLWDGGGRVGVLRKITFKDEFVNSTTEKNAQLSTGENLMPERKPNIVLMGIDSLRADHLSSYGYHRLTTPHIDQFARGGTLFERTYSAHVPTTSAYASMLTGMDCFGTQVVALRHKGELRPEVKTLAEILRDFGYNTTCVGFSGNPSSRGFDTY